ncbi:MAG: D-alanine--D-alanine ligase [Deltaproteobacteria bacterium]|nr:D-alanine--D-alanine ligase [Deltaproteobacteria bacterium]
MTKNRIRVAILYGGRSAEHEVSLRSAASVFAAMDKTKYAVTPVFITKSGAWYIRKEDLSSFAPPEHLSEKQRAILSPDPEHRGFLKFTGQNSFERFPVDLVFPVLHGTFGEDGTLQGLLDLANIPYVGCGTLASAVGMDKIVMKTVFRDIGLNVGPFSWFYRSEWKRSPELIVNSLNDRPKPLFVKPANLGSSVGISKVSDLQELTDAIDRASKYDRRILIEDGIAGRELEVSVLGNEETVASVPGEVVSHAVFYNYDEKYLHDTAELVIPAKLTDAQVSMAQESALRAYRALDGSGLARVDMFLTPQDRIVINEINTLPGFTSISMYPKLWETSGLPYDKLLDRLVSLALDRHHDKNAILTDR